ncbi:hypothetical protein JXB41_01505 [Candidatus Woesearchaeota archaeon]|nr:hypothetical protein [Candidatus Woesearchaeota archaeon]
MNRKKIKKIIFIALIVLLIIIATIFILFFVSVKNKPPQTNIYFTLEPESWIKENTRTNTTDYYIDIKKATRDLAYYDGTKQELLYYGKRITFFSHGVYKGIPFQEAYVDPVFYNYSGLISTDEQRTLIRKYIKITNTNNMDPNDGVSNGFILAKIENMSIVFYIFVDEDWKNNLEFTNIVWGNDLQDTSSLNSKPFDFNSKKNGIYIDKVDYDIDWFKEHTNGGIVVGEIDFNTLSGQDKKGLNTTFIYIQ